MNGKDNKKMAPQRYNNYFSIEIMLNSCQN